jgi:hypothetical protein
LRDSDSRTDAGFVDTKKPLELLGWQVAMFIMLSGFTFFNDGLM